MNDKQQVNTQRVQINSKMNNNVILNWYIINEPLVDLE